MHKNATSEPCDFCGLRLLSVKHLIEHVETEHGKDYLNCTDCKYRCSTRTHLDDHIASHHPATAANVLLKDPPVSSPALIAAPSVTPAEKML